MSSTVKVIAGTFDCTWWHLEHKGWLSSPGVSGICVRNNSELASASLSASLVSFERRSISCMVIRAGVLASCANMSKQKGTLSPGPEGFFKTQSNQTYFFFFFPEFGTEVETGTSIDVVCCCVSSVILSYCFKYDFPDCWHVSFRLRICLLAAVSSSGNSCFDVLLSFWYRRASVK